MIWLKPRCFYDLVIEVAIVRPGPIQGDMVHPYLRRRDGVEKEDYPSPAPEHGPPDELRQILGKTKGVPLFQEQAMRIAMVAARFSDAEVNELRKAMATFRRRGTIGLLEEKMVSSMVARGYAEEFSQRCFNQIKGFGEYGFPESHAASFALLVYVSAWIKCHYPAVFAAAQARSVASIRSRVLASTGFLRVTQRASPSSSTSPLGLSATILRYLRRPFLTPSPWAFTRQRRSYAMRAGA